MKKRLLILLAATALGVYCNSLYAQNDQGNKGNNNDQNNQGNQNDNDQGYRPDFNTWTEQQIVQWEDSVKEAVFPLLKDTVLAASPNSSSGNSSEVNIRRAITPIANNTYVPNSITLDRNKAVGEIPMTSTVSSTGAVTYNVPIEIYPGIHGLQPQLSIAYNHLAGNGILGIGWNISGLSSIARGKRSIYYDSKTVGATLTKDDAFYLDGMRLIKLEESSTQIKYESEQGNIKTTANLNGTVIKYFDVFFPNGTKGIYGYTNNTGTNYLEYPLTALSDLFGNTISYTYTYADNHYRISKISYANASVEFQYATVNRLDILTSYVGGLKIKEDKLLQKISCKYGNTVMYNYDLTFSVQKNVSLLTEIGFSASNGSSFNPLKFYYGENNTASVFSKSDTQLLEWYPWTNPNQIRVSKGKFEYGTQNDGFMVAPGNEYYPYWQHFRPSNFLQHSQNRFDNQYSGTEKIFLHAGFNGSLASPMPNLTTEAGFIDVFAANVDGKGEDEVVKVNNIISGTNDQVNFKVYAPNVYTGLGLKYTRSFNFPTVLTDADGGKSIHAKFYFTGDFNGDGKTEILAVSCNQPFGWTERPTNCYLFDLDFNVKLYDGQPFAYNVTFVGSQNGSLDYARQNSDRLFIFDYDGDGKSDICLINSTGTYIYTFDISGSTYTMRLVASYTGLARLGLADRIVMIGDFNGDGLPDLLLSPKENASDWYIYYSMGNGQFDKVPVSICVRFSSNQFIAQDVNSDGLTDVIQFNATNTFYTKLATTTTLFTGFESSGSIDLNEIPIPANFNNRYDFNQFIALTGSGKVIKYSFSRNDTKERLLTGSITSLGVVTKNYYQMLNESVPIYTQGSGAVFPYVNFNGSVYVPYCREQYLNGQKNENLSYSYENAIVHKQGLGFRGFGKIITYDNVRGRNGYQMFDPLNYGVLKENDSPTTKTVNSWTVTVPGNRIAKVRLSNQSVQDKLRGITTTSAYTYDNYGNPLTESVNYGGAITTTVSNDYSNNTNETGYLIGFLTSRTETVNRNGSTWSQRIYIQTHDKGQPKTLYRYANGNQTSLETFAYDTQGNATSQGVKSYTSAITLTTAYAYDSYGRKTKETDPLGFNTTYEYSSSDGSLTNVKNHKGQAMTYTYDDFKRVKQINYPTGEVETSSYNWTSSEKGVNTVFANYRHHYGRPWTKTFFDALGRETASNSLTLGGTESGPINLYDSYGRLWKVSLPVTSGSGSLWNEYQYDSYDRPVKLTEASGRITSYAYSGNSVTTTVDGIASTQTFDNQGNLILVVDPAGTITYNLRPDGQPASIVAPGNVTTSINYDSYGRRSSIVDPSAGTQSNSYDVAGNIMSESNTDGRTITYGYDDYNRMTRRTRPEFSTTFAYNKDGLLESKTVVNSTSTTYQYDTYGRLYKEKETVPDGKWLEKTYTYLSSGDIGYISYITDRNSNFATEAYSYTNGHLSDINLNGTSIWKLTSANVFGQSTGVTTGSISRTYGYNAYGLPTGRAAGSFQNHTYSFDATKGNLSYRKDNVKNIQESFEYDNLNRLTSYAGKTATYNANGNISSKTDVGTFQYATTGKPYQLSGVTSPTNLIPQRNQTITYTSFRRPATITEGDYTASFTYNSDDERVKMELKKNGAKELTRYYISDCYEMDDRAVGGIKEKLYLGGDFYTAPAVYVKDGSNNWQIYYICRDQLGSITHITNSGGGVVQELSYDAWGQLRNPANQTVYTPGTEPELFLGRGYTGHEHLPAFGLVNMNARLYDAALGRFLSPDPFIQNPFFSQNFNRYSYALNNPLCYIDRDGQIVWFIPIIIGAVVGSYIGGAIANNSYNPFSWDWGSGKTWGYMGGGLVIGGVAGAAAFYGGAALGGAICNGFGVGTGGAVGGAVMGFAGGAIGGSINGAGFTALGGGDFKEIVMGGLNGMLVGAGTGAVAGGIVGGAEAYSNGNNVWSGETIKEGRNAFSFKNTPIKPAPALELLPTSVGNVDVPQPSGNIQLSENVQKTLEQLDQIRQDGGTVSLPSDGLKSNQELNLIIKHSELQLNLRIETHSLPLKYGGAGQGFPIRHMNIEIFPKYPLPNNGHVILTPLK